MKKLSLAKRAIVLPLVGLSVAWVCCMSSVLLGVYAISTYDASGDPVVAELFSSYIYILGLAAVAATSLIAQRLAIRARQESNDSDPLARTAQRFSTLGIVASIFVGAFWILLSFMTESLNLTSYLQVLLITALVVYLVLAGFVFRKDRKIEGLISTTSSGVAEKLRIALVFAIGSFAALLSFVLGIGALNNSHVWYLDLAADCQGAQCGLGPLLTLDFTTLSSLAPAVVLLVLTIVGIYASLTRGRKSVKLNTEGLSPAL